MNEIDVQMDWFRFLRAVEAEHIERIEDLLAKKNEGSLKNKDLSEDDHAAIIEHDKLLRKYDNI